MDQQQHPNALPSGTQLHSYAIERVLGAGGFGITYKAREHVTGRQVAIKEYLPLGLAVRDGNGPTLRPASDRAQADFEWGLERFRNEATLLTMLKHPNIVPVLSYFEANATGYFAMEYLKGRSLRDVLEERGTISQNELLALLEPLLSAVDEVHRRGILHRDIKPDNILIRSNGTPILLDFGAARQALGQHSRGLTAVLTEGYAPHEQYYSDGHQGPWTDIYAIGALAYHCVLGRLPAPASKRVSAMMRSSADPIGSGLAEVRKFAPHLANAIEQALAVHEEDRPQSVSELHDLIRPTYAETLVLRAQSRPTETPREDRMTRHRTSAEYEGKYRGLYEHLMGLNQSEWRASFREVEEVLGFKLPRSARLYQAWWANAATAAHPYSQSWQLAGWKTSQLDIGGERVVFVRERRPR